MWYYTADKIIIGNCKYYFCGGWHLSSLDLGYEQSIMGQVSGISFDEVEMWSREKMTVVYA